MGKRSFGRATGLLGVTMLGLFAIVASGGSAPQAPTNFVLEVPAATGGSFETVAPVPPGSANSPATFKVMPLAGTVPAVRISFTIPTNTLPAISVTDNSVTPPTKMSLPQITNGNGDPALGFWVMQTTAPWRLLVQLPASLAASKWIILEVTDTSSGYADVPADFNLVMGQIAKH